MSIIITSGTVRTYISYLDKNYIYFDPEFGGDGTVVETNMSSTDFKEKLASEKVNFKIRSAFEIVFSVDGKNITSLDYEGKTRKIKGKNNTHKSSDSMPFDNTAITLATLSSFC